MRSLAAILAAAALLTFGALPATVHAADKAAQEESVTLDQVPAPVKATIQKEADGGAVGTITKETRRGKTYYEAQITKDGKDRYVNIAADGKVIKRKGARGEAKDQSKGAGTK